MFKNISAFIGTPETMQYLESSEMADMAEELRLVPPVATSWRSFGFVQPEEFGDSLVYDNGMGVRVFAIGIAERALPGKCIQDELNKRRVKMEKMENRRLGRKEIAQMKDLVISELLPNAPVKTSVTLVVTKGKWIMIDTSSANRAEEIIAFLRSTMPISQAGTATVAFSCVPLSGAQTHKWLRGIALDEPIHDTYHFNRLDAIVLKGQGGTVRLKDVDLGSTEAQHNLTSGRDVVELLMSYSQDDESDNVDLHCAVNDNLTIKRIKFSDILIKDIAEDAGDDGNRARYFDASLVISVGLFTSLLNKIADETAKPEDDDEL